MDVPIKVAVRIAAPPVDRRLRRLPQPLFQIFELALQAGIQFELSNGEVAELIIPIHIQPHVPPGEYPFRVQIKAEPAQQGMRIRSDQSANRVGDIKIRHPQGLGIAQITSWGFEAKQSPTQTFPVVVGEAADPPQEVDLKPQFNSLWVPEDWEVLAVARQEANDRRIYAVPDLKTEPLYLAFMEESKVLFGDSGVQLHVAEAIFLSKILTFTVTYLMSNAEWQDIVLVPIYASAQLTNSASDNALWLVTQLGYAHIVELAVALSFSLVEDNLQQQPWDATEQRVVREYIVGCLQEGATLPAEFLYLPLLLGGVAVADKVVFEGEDVAESLRFLNQAKAARANLFAEEDLRELNNAFGRLVARQARGRR